MSWIELDDQILEHPKFIRAVKAGGADALHLWLGLRAYCSQKLTDGLVPADMVDEVRGPRDPKRREAALAALRSSGLLDEHPDGVMMHDYLQWSSSREEVLGRREKARERKARSRGPSHTPSRRDTQRDSTGDDERDTGSDTPRDSERSSAAVTDPRARVSSASSSSEGDPPTPFSAVHTGPLPKDPFGDTLRKPPPGRRPDVLRLWERFKSKLGYPPKTKFRGGDWDEDAVRIAEAVDAYDEPTCEGVIDAAPLDGMVNGTADENGQKHDTVAYVFGNQNTFNRLLKAAEDLKTKRPLSVREVVRMAREAR